MDTPIENKRIALLGGGPAALFMLKRLIESRHTGFEISIFEKSEKLGAGMPYSRAGANEEHVTNVSDNEIPHIVTSIHEWVHTAPVELLNRFNIIPEKFNEYKVLPRLFFGEYLAAQFQLVLNEASRKGLKVTVHLQHSVTDIIDKPLTKEVWIETDKSGILKYDQCVICTGHYWPLKNEGNITGYYDSPYPPAKLAIKCDHPVAVRGSSLTAIDAIKTLARHNGTFITEDSGRLLFNVDEGSNFKIVLHSRNGMLPAVRFHLEDSHLSDHSALTPEMIAENIKMNEGFLSLDFVFETAFKEPLKHKDAELYEKIKDNTIEEFVDSMMELRERLDPFILFHAEFREAEKSIRRHESVYWKELLAVLSFTMNYPAKHFSAEDMQRLQHSLSHLITIVIAFVPQGSGKELMALHAAGVLDIIAVGADGEIEPEPTGGITYHYRDHEHKKQSIHYNTFIDSIGQPHLNISEFPFKTLVKEKTVSAARLKFKNAELAKKELQNGNELVEKETDGTYFLKVPGIAINDNFQILNESGAYNERIYMMSVAFISGFNPDYSGLDFCEEASKIITKDMLNR